MYVVISVLEEVEDKGRWRQAVWWQSSLQHEIDNEYVPLG